MKLRLLIITLFITSINYSQNKFENGVIYFKNGNNIDCEIKNKNWYQNPNSFIYNLNNNETEVSINEIDSLQILDNTKYIRSYINGENVLLKAIVESKVSLYELVKENAEKFYYKTESKPITELLYEEFINDEGFKQKKYGYIFQLYTDVNCTKLPLENNSVKYNVKELKKYFIEYNDCSKNNISHLDKRKPILFSLGILAGINSVNSKLENKFPLPKFYNKTSYDFGNSTNFKTGISFEISLPYNNYKWSILNEILYTKLELDGKHLIRESPELNYLYKSKYNNLEYLIGGKYSFFLNDNSKLYIESLFNLFTLEASKNTFVVIDDTDNTEIPLKVDYGNKIVLGFGYSLKNKYTIGFRYNSTQNYIYGNDNFSQKNQETYLYFKYNFNFTN